MSTQDLFPIDPPYRGSTTPRGYTPRVPMSVQGPRPRVPLPSHLRSKPSTANSGLFVGSLTSQHLSSALSPADMRALCVVPYSISGDAAGVGLIDDEARSVDNARIRYASFVQDVYQKVDLFQSPTLFAESIMKEMECRETTTPAMKVAAATWALEIVSAQPGFEFLRQIRNTLLPALYVKYTDDKLHHVSRSVHTMIQQVPVAVVQQNPFLSHDLFAEEYLVREAERIQAQHMQGKLSNLGLSRKNAVQHLTEQLGSLRKTFALRAWRNYTFRKKFDRVARANRIIRRDESTRVMMLQNSFSVWKSTVERSRSIFLSERLHNAASQLENSKNQFQLQCFRSDKHLFTVEELRAEMQAMRKEYETLIGEKRELERKLRDHDVDTTNQLNHHVNVVLRELSTWRRFARRCIEGLSVHDETVKALEEQQKSMSEYLSNSDDDDRESSPLKKTTNKPIPAGPSSPTSALGETTTSSSLQGSQQHAKDMSGNSEAILLAWVRSIVQSAPVSLPNAPAANFTTDFQSGEIMLLVLHHVFPNDVPLTPLQEASLSKRLERIVASFVKCGVAMVPRPCDFTDCNSDVIFVVLAELFGRNLQLQSLRKAKELVEGSYTGLEDTVTSKIEYTLDMLPSVLDSSKTEIDQLIQQEAALRQQSGTLLKWQESVGRDAAFATRERMSGNPVRAIGKSNVEKYWKFKVSRYADLEQKYKVRDEAWKEHLAGNVRKVLQKYVHTTSRLFFRYAGSPTLMNEVNFWRLAFDYKFNDKPLSSGAVEKIFTQVAKPLGPNPDLHDGSENITLQDISPQDFIETLVRVADAKYTAKSLPERLEMLMTHINKITASKEESPLVKLVFSEASQKVMDRFLVDLARIFLFYGKRLPRQNSGRLMSVVLHVDHFSQLFDEIGAVRVEGGTVANDAFVTSTDIKNVLKGVTLQEEGPPLQEIFFHHFLEALGSLCMYRTPDPLIPIEKKIEVLLSSIVARARLRNKGSTLVVSDVRIVTV